jgi:secondary thiamine-phosphate synthase enzyme
LRAPFVLRAERVGGTGRWRDPPGLANRKLAMRQTTSLLPIRAAAPGLHEFTSETRKFVAESGIRTGLLTIFCRHTSASLLIQENAAPAARRDLERYFERIAPEGDNYEHDDEGPDDMPAHLRSALTQSSLSIPIIAGELALGTWQGIYLFEHRGRPPRREIALHIMGA